MQRLNQFIHVRTMFARTSTWIVIRSDYRCHVRLDGFCITGSECLDIHCQQQAVEGYATTYGHISSHKCHTNRWLMNSAKITYGSCLNQTRQHQSSQGFEVIRFLYSRTFPPARPVKFCELGLVTSLRISKQQVSKNLKLAFSTRAISDEGV